MSFDEAVSRGFEDALAAKKEREQEEDARRRLRQAKVSAWARLVNNHFARFRLPKSYLGDLVHDGAWLTQFDDPVVIGVIRESGTHMVSDSVSLHSIERSWHKEARYFHGHEVEPNAANGQLSFVFEPCSYDEAMAHLHDYERRKELNRS